MDRRLVLGVVVLAVAYTLNQFVIGGTNIYGVLAFAAETKTFTWWQAYMVANSVVGVGWTAAVSYLAVYACRRWATQPARAEPAGPR